MEVQEESEAYLTKLRTIKVLAYIKNNGVENLPMINRTVSCKNGKLSCIEQPELVKKHPENGNYVILNTEDFDLQEIAQKVESKENIGNDYKNMLLQHDPMLYYKLITNS